MSCKDITTQAELDAALADDAVACVHIKSGAGVWLTVADNRSKTVRAYGSASVRAYGSASVRAYGSASVQAYDSASVQAYGSASVQAYGSASVQAYGSASVQAYGSASVQAYGSASVRASTHVSVHLHDATATVSGGVLVDLTQLDLADPQAWAEYHGADITDGRITLYKALGDDLTTGQRYGNQFVYVVGADLVCADWRDDNDCGGGLHLSPTPHQATAYRDSATRWMRCTAPLSDVRPILDGGTAKAKVRTLRVEEEVDVFGRPTQTAEVAA